MGAVVVGRRPGRQEGDFGLQVVDLSLELFHGLARIFVALLACADVAGGVLRRYACTAWTLLRVLLPRAQSPQHLPIESATSSAKPRTRIVCK
ncbi:hypothetical protein NL676_026282 [Syzygium grande]|nr:hypothetical protein NL676_026282 [Syzygium grande]